MNYKFFINQIQNMDKAKYPIDFGQSSVTLSQQEQENLKVIQKLIAAFSVGDYQETLTCVTDDVEYISSMPKEIPIAGIFQGHEGVIKYQENLKNMYEMEWEEHKQIISQGNTVIIIGRERTRVMPSGKMLEVDFVLLFSFRNGKIFKFQGFTDTAALLKAYLGE